MTTPVAPRPLPALGLVCITASPQIRYRTMTRTTYLKLAPEERAERLRELYLSNIEKFLEALSYCAWQGIRLYRVSSQLFPLSDWEDGVGAAVLEGLAGELARIGVLATARGVRVVVHPEQFVVLSSDSQAVADSAMRVLQGHARQMDLMGLPRSQWSMVLVHGGKSGRGEALAARIGTLPENIRSRLALENDEYAYSAQDILEVCQKTGVAFVFDAHHHAVHAKLEGYEDASIAHFTREAASTWTDPAWQIVHLSNGKSGFLDRKHSDLIDAFPSAFLDVPFVEIEAKGKEVAIADLLPRLQADVPVLSITRASPPEAAFPDEE
jgi:UV DNA damage endonuclease